MDQLLKEYEETSIDKTFLQTKVGLEVFQIYHQLFTKQKQGIKNGGDGEYIAHLTDPAKFGTHKSARIFAFLFKLLEFSKISYQLIADDDVNFQNPLIKDAANDSVMQIDQSHNQRQRPALTPEDLEAIPSS